ncbi:MAG: HEPN domain-containing protein [Planctomycetota bacterium]|nr:HEPN domain-containing protein [Planctomycetota bacterium]
MTDHHENIPTVRDLRRCWKPHKERLSAGGGEQPTSIRFHRACSWIDRVEKNAECEDYDVDLVCLWIAFNSLYGQWDEETREPRPDRERWRAFVDSVLRLDETGFVAASLVEHKRLVMTLLEDEYLSSYFWKEPGAKRAGQSKKSKYNAQNWYIEKRWVKILDELLERLYLMRCQLVHGAATHAGKLNRTSLTRCVWMMKRLLPAFLMVWIDHGADEDWGPICFPPLGKP